MWHYLNVPREKDNWDPKVVNLEAKYNTNEVWHNKDRQELHPHTNYFVGGNTKFYGAALFCLRKEDFGEIKHHGGASTMFTVSAAKTPASRQRGSRTLIRRSVTNRACSNSRISACGRFTPRSVSCY